VPCHDSGYAPTAGTTAVTAPAKQTLDAVDPSRLGDSKSVSSAGSYIWLILCIAVTAQTAGSITSQGIYVLVPFWKSEFALSQATAALAVGFVNGGQILSMFALGRAIDSYGERVIVGLTMIMMGLTALAAAAFVTSFPMLLLMIMVLGAFYASVQPGGTRAILRWFPPEHRGVATGFRQASVPLGTAIAALVLPALTMSFGWRGALFVQGIIGIAGGLVFWLFYSERVGDGIQDLNSPAPKLSLPELRKALGRDKAFWVVLRAGIVMSAFQFTFATHAILFMADHFKLGLVASASFFALTQIVGIPGRVIVPWISDRMLPGRRALALGYLMLACAAAAIALVFLPAQSAPWMLWGILAILGVALSWFPLYLIQIAEMAPKSAIAATVGFGTTLSMVAMAVAPFMFGFLVDMLGYEAAWIVLTAPILVAAFQLCRLPRT
jgi:sugar phosphate permease